MKGNSGVMIICSSLRLPVSSAGLDIGLFIYRLIRINKEHGILIQ